MGEHALIVYLYDLGERAAEAGVDALDALVDLQNQLCSAIEDTGLGDVDGNEIALDDSEGSLFMYGPDAKAMLQAALPHLCQSILAPKARVYLRYGRVDVETAREEEFSLADLCARRNA